MQYQNIALVPGVALPYSGQVPLPQEQPRDGMQQDAEQEAIQETLQGVHELKQPRQTAIPKEMRGIQRKEGSDKQDMT